MSDKATHIISGIRSNWEKQELIARLILAFSIATPLTMLLAILFHISLWWIMPTAIVIFLAGLKLFPTWRIDDTQVTSLLNNRHPELEESTGLLLKPSEQLGLLETFQVRKINTVLERIVNEERSFSGTTPGLKTLKRSALMFVISIALAGMAFAGNRYFYNNDGVSRITVNDVEFETEEEELPPSIKDVSVTIRPPAYTGADTRSQSRMNIRAEQGSRITWQINTNGAPTSLSIVFNDSTTLALKPGKEDPNTFTADRSIKSNGFYQIKTGDVLSEFYQLEVIPDQQPAITVQTPKPSTIIEYGQSQQIPLAVNLSDDYGISSSGIIATIASGNGEAVKFKEQRLAFNNFEAGAKQYRLTKSFNLSALGMRPGDELYFYVTGTDNNKQETRSDIFTIRIEDTAALLSMDGMMSGVDIKPEFFRSQRQIIIETEQLLKSRDTMSAQSFNNKCNDLGLDQKLLRLRYGKFLGEEDETNIGIEGAGHDHEGEEKHAGSTDAKKEGKKDGKIKDDAAKHKEGDEHDDEYDQKISAEDFNNAEKIIDRYSHKHDIAEDATFFDPQTKKDLKAVLAEMWDAELRLRTYKATDALPFEYKALRLLKELQQKSREYVAKTNTKTTPLKPEKRLTGELDKIVETRGKQEYIPGNKPEQTLRIALAKLDSLKYKASVTATGNQSTASLPAETLSASDIDIFQKTAGELSLKASAEPARYLRSFEAIKRILKNEGSIADISVTANALQTILKRTSALPVSKQAVPNRGLSKEYFMNLNKPGR